jgi:hypothetical protein
MQASRGGSGPHEGPIAAALQPGCVMTLLCSPASCWMSTPSNSVPLASYCICVACMQLRDYRTQIAVFGLTAGTVCNM